MPVYVYKCDACGLAFERKQSVSEGPLHDCPECEGHVRRVIQPVGVLFKGSGFYVTDNRSHAATTDAPGSKAKDKEGSKESSTEAESKPAAGGGESAPTSTTS